METVRWRAVRRAWTIGVPVQLIAELTGLVTKTITALAARHGWPPHPGDAGPAGVLAAADDPRGIRANMMAAVSRRFGALSMEEAADEERLAKAMTALVRTTEAAGRLADAFGTDGVEERHERSDADVRHSIRRKLQAWLGRSRETRGI